MGNNISEAAKHQDEISFKEIVNRVGDGFKYLLSKWTTILLISTIGGVLGFIYAYLKNPVYKAELNFALEDEKSSGGLGGALGLASQLGFDLGSGGGGVFSGDNLLELMKSRTMTEKTLLTAVNIKGKKETLADYYIDFNGLRSKWSKEPLLRNIKFPVGQDRSTFTRQQDSLLGEFYNNLLKDNLRVQKPDKKLSIISVSIVSNNELFSKYFDEILVKQVSDFYIDTKSKKARQNTAILEFQTDSVRKRLNAFISGVALSMDNNPNSNPNRQILKTPAQRNQVDVQANTLILGELVKNLEVARVTLRKETPLIQIIDSPIFPLEKTETSKTKSTIIGFLLAGIMSILVLSFKKYLSN